MTLGEKIRELRVNNGLTQDELGEMLGYKGKTPGMSVWKWEKGGRPVPKNKLEDLMAIFNTRLDDLSSDEDIKFNKGQNNEGYPDPTASKAIKNTNKSQDITNLYVGNVYGVNVSTNKRDVAVALLCLNWDDDYIYGFPVYRPNEAPVGITSHMYKITGFYVDIRSIRNFRRKRVTKELFALDNHKELTAIKRAAASKFGLTCDGEQKVVEVPVEKVVEVPVEKVVEKVVEVKVPQDDTSVKLLRQRADIYQDICEKLLARGIAL